MLWSDGGELVDVSARRLSTFKFVLHDRAKAKRSSINTKPLQACSLIGLSVRSIW